MRSERGDLIFGEERVDGIDRAIVRSLSADRAPAIPRQAGHLSAGHPSRVAHGRAHLGTSMAPCST